MTAIPIDARKNSTQMYDQVFDSLPVSLIDKLNNHFSTWPMSEEEIHWPRLSVLVLEHYFALRVGGADYMSLGHTMWDWMHEYAPKLAERFCIPVETLDIGFVEQNLTAYTKAADRLLASKAADVPIHTYHVFQHPQTQVRYENTLTVGPVCYVSNAHITHTRFSNVFHGIAQLFDPRVRVCISDYVHNMPFARKLLPSENAYKNPDDNDAPDNTPLPQLSWNIVHLFAFKANLKVLNVVVCFDLEWNNLDLKTRYTQGQLVDAHFQDYTSGWVIFTGLIKVPPKTTLSPFLLQHGYRVQKLLNGSDKEMLAGRIQEVLAVCHEPIFTSYNGANSDYHVLKSNGIYLPFLDSNICLHANCMVSLAAAFQAAFGEKFRTHRASSDTKAMIALMKHRKIDERHIRQLYHLLQQMNIRLGTDESPTDHD